MLACRRIANTVIKTYSHKRESFLPDRWLHETAEMRKLIYTLFIRPTQLRWPKSRVVRASCRGCYRCQEVSYQPGKPNNCTEHATDGTIFRHTEGRELFASHNSCRELILVSTIAWSLFQLIIRAIPARYAIGCWKCPLSKSGFRHLPIA